MTEGGKAYVDEFNSAGPYPRMEAAGIPAATVNALKNNGVVDIVLYSIESAVDPLTYAESKGYVVYRPVVVPPA
jgi:hypothetical protein